MWFSTEKNRSIQQEYSEQWFLKNIFQIEEERCSRVKTEVYSTRLQGGTYVLIAMESAFL